MTSQELNTAMEELHILQAFLQYSRLHNLLTSISHLAIRREIARIQETINHAKENQLVMGG